MSASKQIFGEVSDSDGEEKMEMLEGGDSLDMMSTQQSMDYSLPDAMDNDESSKLTSLTNSKLVTKTHKVHTSINLEIFSTSQ